MFKVKKLHPDAILPTVAHPGEDLGYDVYALENTMLILGVPNKVRTGIAGHYTRSELFGKFGLLVEDRSSMAEKGIFKSAGVIDAGYRGELKIMLTSTRSHYLVKARDKIAQLVPQRVLTDEKVEEVETLDETTRGEGGFGSTGV